MSYAGEASEVLDEAITDGQGRFRIRIDRESARIDVDGPLPDDVESTDSFSLDLPAAGVDLTHDLVLQPAGVPEPIWDSWSRDDTDIRKLWWEESGPGSSPVTGYVIRTWEADEDELSPRKVTEQCVGPGTFATAPLQGDLATVQAVNERGVSALDAWNDDAGPERPDGPTPTIVDCSTLFDGDAVTDPPEPQSPGQPAAVTSGDIASRSATVSWEEGPGGPATAYRVQISHGTDFTDLVQEQVVSAPVTSHRFTALTNGVVHHARVRAENPHGVSVWAVSDPFTPDAAPPAPGRPAVALRPSAAVVTWQPGSVTDEHGAATEFLVRARQGAGTWSTMATVPAGTLRTRVTGLSPRKKYTFVVVARNAVAESNASPGRAVVAQTRPAKPRAVKAVPRKRAVLIRWKPGVLRAQHGTRQRYLVQRKVGAQWRTVKSLPSKARQHRVARLTPGKVIRLRVVARGAVGDTASAVVRAKPRR